MDFVNFGGFRGFREFRFLDPPLFRDIVNFPGSDRALPDFKHDHNYYLSD